MYPLSARNQVLFLTLFLLFTTLSAHADGKPGDVNALAGIKEVKAVYDLRVKEPKRFSFFLDVISQTYDSIREQGRQPVFVVAVRGPSIRFLTTETWSFSENEQKFLGSAASRIKDLKSRGVTFEACSIAAGLFKVDHSTYLPEVTPVSNTFISLTGYQAQGYGLVPVN